MSKSLRCGGEETTAVGGFNHRAGCTCSFSEPEYPRRVVDPSCPLHGEKPDVTMTTSDKSFAPWTEEQVRNLNAYQVSGWHPFTCGSLTCPSGTKRNTPLVATPEGWVCPSCDYKQNWAHDFMTKPVAPASPFNSSITPATQPVGDEEIEKAITELLDTQFDFAFSPDDLVEKRSETVTAARASLSALIEKRVVTERIEAGKRAIEIATEEFAPTIARLRSDLEKADDFSNRQESELRKLRSENDALRSAEFTPDEAMHLLNQLPDLTKIADPFITRLRAKLSRSLTVGTPDNKEG